VCVADRSFPGLSGVDLAAADRGGRSGKGQGLFLSRVRCEDGLEINAWHPGVVVAALIDARRVVMRLLRVVGLPAWQDDDFPSAEAAREEQREFLGAKCDRFAG
jgi:hypothetical protein